MIDRAFSVAHAAEFRQSKNEATWFNHGYNVLPVDTHFKCDHENLFVDWSQINKYTSIYFVFTRIDFLSIPTPGSSG